MSWNRMGLALFACATLTGCGQGGEDRGAATAIPPPSLWRVEIVEDSGGAAGAVDVCANPELISSFSRAEPSIGGQPCVPYGKPATETATEHVGRCELNGQRYGLYLSTKGDLTSDFTVRFALQPLQVDVGKVVQARRYHRLGACPASWKAGDQAKVGSRPTSNLLAPKP